MYKSDRYKFYPECQDPCHNMEVSTFFLFKSDGYHGIKFTFMRKGVDKNLILNNMDSINILDINFIL